MIFESRSVLIRAGGGRVRVLRLVCADGHTWPLRYTAPIGPGCCACCGCTDRFGCEGGCAWVNIARTLCSRCYERTLT